MFVSHAYLSYVRAPADPSFARRSCVFIRLLAHSVCSFIRFFSFVRSSVHILLVRSFIRSFFVHGFIVGSSFVHRPSVCSFVPSFLCSFDPKHRRRRFSLFQSSHIFVRPLRPTTVRPAAGDPMQSAIVATVAAHTVAVASHASGGASSGDICPPTPATHNSAGHHRTSPAPTDNGLVRVEIDVAQKPTGRRRRRGGGGGGGCSVGDSDRPWWVSVEGGGGVVVWRCGEESVLVGVGCDQVSALFSRVWSGTWGDGEVGRTLDSWRWPGSVPLILANGVGFQLRLRRVITGYMHLLFDMRVLAVSFMFLARLSRFLS